MMLIDFGKNIGFNCKQTAEFNLLLFTISITNFNHEEMSRVKFKNKNLRPLKFWQKIAIFKLGKNWQNYHQTNIYQYSAKEGGINHKWV